ncbi:PadR family transcriptional regulator [Phycicoccus sp. Root563]|uniref:PadR family transcriptional regulator n=1 Tax=unclassified Phycicoccus TaxID=2637926 RepID=UPI00070277B9|nr:MULTISPECIES: PadR family transcriptional regulator [unclassified Phycicoccus]KQU69186.1 PadR family transcriptional regulator [Phycicoccus sp. Root101]KQZ90390.1 PadR family transcriptional regulator [Phycicoccus sp. Root563]
MSTGHVLLGLLSRGQRHGYDLKRDHDERFPQAKPLAFGVVYSTLERLHRRGLIAPLAVQRVDGPDRTAYGITDAGRAELAQWLATTDEPSEHVTNPFAVKVTLALLLGDEAGAEAFLRAQRAAHLVRMRAFTTAKTAPGASVHEVLAADYALAHLDADLTWMDAALRRVTTLREELGA